MTYLDWAASAPPDPEILEEARQVSLRLFGNPSSLHRWGKEARQLLESCRERCATVLGARPEQIVFTSGATESNNVVLLSLLERPGSSNLIVGELEHSSVLGPSYALKHLSHAKVGRSSLLPDKTGFYCPKKLARLVARKKSSMVSIAMIDSHLGICQPIKQLKEASAEEKRPPHFHSDLTQAIGKQPVDLTSLNIDSASFGAHKIGGPRGIGGLYLKKEVPPLFFGGKQERGRRPGTENLPGVLGLTLALEKSQKTLTSLPPLMKTLLEGIDKIPGRYFFPPERPTAKSTLFSPTILCVGFPPLPGEALARVLNEKGFGISQGSACESRFKKENHALAALGIESSLVKSAIRVSLGPGTTEEELVNFVGCLEAVLKEL